MSNIAKDDIYYIIIPIGIAIFGWIFQYLSGRFGYEKQWKNVREKSSRESFSDYFLIMLLFGILWFAIYIFLACFLIIIFEIELADESLQYSYAIFNVLLYACLMFGIQKKDIKFKIKELDKHAKIMTKIPAILSCVIWSFILFDWGKIIIKIDVIFILAFEIFFIIALDGESEFKYAYVSFYFYDGKTIKNISTKKVFQKRNWIVAGNDKMEYRFRIKDIKKVEYSNSLGCDICVP